MGAPPGRASLAATLAHSNGLIIFPASLSQLTSETLLSNRSNLPLYQVSMFNTSPISRKCDISMRTCKLLRHIIPLEEIDRNCLQLSYALFFGLIHISLTFSERDVGTALSYRDKNHFGASISRKTNFKSSIWKWQRHPFRKSSKLRASLFVIVRSGQTNYQLHHPPLESQRMLCSSVVATNR